MFARADVRKTGALVVGHSAGGWGALALASRNPPDAADYVRTVTGVDFAAAECGWASKAAAISRIAAELDIPADAKDYLHRSGRTGRAGAAGVVVAFVMDENHAKAAELQRALGMARPNSGPTRGNARRPAASRRGGRRRPTRARPRHRRSA